MHFSENKKVTCRRGKHSFKKRVIIKQWKKINLICFMYVEGHKYTTTCITVRTFEEKILLVNPGGKESYV